MKTLRRRLVVATIALVLIRFFVETVSAADPALETSRPTAANFTSPAPTLIHPAESEPAAFHPAQPRREGGGLFGDGLGNFLGMLGDAFLVGSGGRRRMLINN